VSERAPGVGHERFPTERYEELRSTALGVTAAGNGRGLALVMRYGVVAWMRAWASLVAPRPTPPENRAQAQLPAACPEVVRVLAEMAMAAAREGVSA
jgi:DNA-binding transcriptional LysR family regulator